MSVFASQAPSYLTGRSAFDNYFLQAQRVRQLIKNDFDRVFRIPNYFSDSISEQKSEVDVILHPSSIRTAPRLSKSNPDSDLSAYMQDVLTVPASLAGLPALSVPVGCIEGQLPVGISVVGQWGTDELVLAVGEALEGL